MNKSTITALAKHKVAYRNHYQVKVDQNWVLMLTVLEDLAVLYALQQNQSKTNNWFLTKRLVSKETVVLCQVEVWKKNLILATELIKSGVCHSE